ncbi:MAG: DUF4832 domain-containing protein [Dermatophilaceae bacterium]
MTTVATAASPAAPATAAPAEVEDAASPTGKAWSFIRNGDTLTVPQDVAAGTDELVATARADLFEGAPRLDLSVSGGTVGREVSSTTYAKVSFGEVTVSADEPVVATMADDRYDGAADRDRNVHLASVALEPVSAASPAAGSAATIDTTYTADGSLFLNPERGFHDNIDTSGTFASTRANGYTMSRFIIRLDEFRSGPLSQGKLDEIDASLTEAAESGVKVMPNFMYNFPAGVDVENDASNVDAPLDVVLGHLDQLKPLFEEHRGVIATMYNGFIGAWGEWHSSSNGLDKEPARSQIWKKILEVLPPDRMMTTRAIPAYEEMTGAGMTKEMAYDGSEIARTGMANQCFLATESDAGSYDWQDPESDMKVLEGFSTYTPIIGETCQIENETTRSDCETARGDLERFHWSSLNAEFHEPTLTKWKKDGCYEEFDRRMGYRLELKSSSVQESVKAGEALSASFVVRNVGYAAPFNPRGLDVVLRNKDTGTTYPMSVLKERDAALDPRMWFREAGEVTASAAPVVPADVPAGTYDVLLGLPDPVPALSTRPEYSIRLANQGVWEESTGLNLLATGVTVTR